MKDTRFFNNNDDSRKKFLAQEVHQKSLERFAPSTTFRPLNPYFIPDEVSGSLCDL